MKHIFLLYIINTDVINLPYKEDKQTHLNISTVGKETDFKYD